MALTRLDRTGDGSTTRYSVSFDLGYLRREYVYVYLEGDDYQNQLDYSWVTTSEIELVTPVPSGQVFHIRRVVPRDNIINDYEDGAILRESNLDDSFLQAIMILQEIQDGYLAPTDDANFSVQINMLGKKIINLGDATEPTDAMNLQRVIEEISQQLNAYDPETYIDYGLITATIQDELDYGGLN